ncbi:hypothetical protein [Streptomyces sp. NPDC048419]|uniref:hypothetical protein n=1 Tax=Streptomyces sp. NPDC048419 TaxID=3365547 RepID=UPI00372417D8
MHRILTTVSTSLARPVIGAVRLGPRRSGFVAEALATANDTGGTGIRLVHADSKFYTADVAAACRRAGPDGANSAMIR